MLSTQEEVDSRNDHRMEELLKELDEDIVNLSIVENARDNIFLSCSRASLVKAYEFAGLTTSAVTRSAYFLAPALRGIAEDIIFLRFISKRLSELDRESLLAKMMLLEVHDKVKVQSDFFRNFRPLQKVLSCSNDDDSIKLKDEIKSIWQLSGFPNLKKVYPNTQKMATKDSTTSVVIYNYVYRFSSGLVHFNPRVLLRSGWGTCEEDEFTFSTKHMSSYYLYMCRVYGVFLFCLYFHFFPEHISLEQSSQKKVSEILEYTISIPRWPEIVTFEEMNIPFTPQPSNLLTFPYITRCHKEAMETMLKASSH